MFSVAIFFIGNLVRKVTTNQWNLFYTAKSGKYHSSKKQSFPLEISLYKLWGCFFTTLLVSQWKFVLTLSFISYSTGKKRLNSRIREGQPLKSDAICSTVVLTLIPQGKRNQSYYIESNWTNNSYTPWFFELSHQCKELVVDIWLVSTLGFDSI